MGEKVSKEIEPDAIESMTVNDAGQIYLGKDLAGCEVTVAYEVEESAASDDPGTATPTAGSATHRSVLKQSVATLNKLGATTTLPRQNDTNPDAIATLPSGSSTEASGGTEIHPQLHSVSHDRDMNVEAMVSRIQRPVAVLETLRRAIEASRTCVFATAIRPEEDTPTEYLGENIERTLYSTQETGFNYDTISCVQETFDNGDRKFFIKGDKLTTDTGCVVVGPHYPVHAEEMWREDEGGIVAISRGGEKGGQQELARFDDVSQLAEPEAETTRHREKRGDQWVVKTGEGEEAEVEATYPNLTALNEDYIDLHAPFIPENEFPRPVEDDDFSILLFPVESVDHPKLYQHGQIEPLLDGSYR